VWKPLRCGAAPSQPQVDGQRADEGHLQEQKTASRIDQQSRPSKQRWQDTKTEESRTFVCGRHWGVVHDPAPEDTAEEGQDNGAVAEEGAVRHLSPFCGSDDQKDRARDKGD